MAKIREVPLYDWATEDFEKVRSGGNLLYKRFDRDRRWEVLIYVGRYIHGDTDPGIYMKTDFDHSILRTLYERGYLTGRALQDAKELFPELSPTRVRIPSHFPIYN